MDNEHDISSMKLLLSGNERGLDAIMVRWKGPIAAYIYRMVGNYQDAVEIAQEVFVKIYFERERFNLEKPFGPWIYTIASNLAKNRLRWRFRHKSEALDELTLVDYQHATGKTNGIIMECLQKLPAEFRETIVLFDIEDRSHEEIAEIIGKSRKTVEARLYKARELLKKAYLDANISGAYVKA